MSTEQILERLMREYWHDSVFRMCFLYLNGYIIWQEDATQGNDL